MKSFTLSLTLSYQAPKLLDACLYLANCPSRQSRIKTSWTKTAPIIKNNGEPAQINPHAKTQRNSEEVVTQFGLIQLMSATKIKRIFASGPQNIDAHQPSFFFTASFIFSLSSFVIFLPLVLPCKSFRLYWGIYYFEHHK